MSQQAHADSQALKHGVRDRKETGTRQLVASGRGIQLTTERPGTVRFSGRGLVNKGFGSRPQMHRGVF